MSGYMKNILQSKLSRLMNSESSEDGAPLNDNHILKSWIQNRLREYFVIKDARLQRFKSKSQNISPIVKADNFEVMSHELKVFDVKLITLTNNGSENDAEWDKFMDIFIGFDPKNRPGRFEHEAFRTGKAHLSVTYMESSRSPTKTIHLLAHVGQIDDMSLIEDIPPFIQVSQKHTIDIYTKIFPMLEDWSNTRGIKITFPIPKCYFGKYEDGQKVFLGQVLSANNDIMSKVNAGIEIDAKTPVFDSHRLLLLEDVQRNGFEDKNVDNSTFLPLLNVKAALKKLSVIHCTSWAFTKITNKTFTSAWPFISNEHFLPFIKTKAQQEFPSFIRLIEDYLTKQAAADKDRLIQYLISLELKLSTTLAMSTVPSSGPLCLIHQGLNFSTVLFRHSLIPQDSTDEKDSSITTKSGYFKEIRQPKVRHTNIGNKPMLIKREVCIVDWQNATFGSPMIDVASLLLNSLPPQTRKTETRALLKLYWNEFEVIAAKFGLTLPWTVGEMFNEYLQGLIFASLLVIANDFADLKQDRDRVEVLVQAIRDLIEVHAI